MFTIANTLPLILFLFSTGINCQSEPEPEPEPDYVLSQQLYSQLSEIQDREEYSLNGSSYLGKVASVIDGDTVKVIIKQDGTFYKFSFRLTGIDTPQKSSGVVRDFGKKVKDILDEMIGGKIVKVDAGEFDLYGRPLGVIIAMTVDDVEININNYLVETEMAKEYDGGTKEEFVQEDYDAWLVKYSDYQWLIFKHFPLFQPSSTILGASSLMLILIILS